MTENIVEDVVLELDIVPTDEPSIEPEVVEADVVEPEVVEADVVEEKEIVEVIAQEFAIEVFPEIYSFEGEYVEEESAE